MARTTKPKETITKADLTKSFWRTMFGLQLGWNYEKYQGLGYCFAMIPILKKLYPEKDKLNEAVKVHLNFFNTTPHTAHLIIGANIAMEEQFGLANKEGVAGLKTGLMGPFAGIGDTVFVAIYRAIVFALASYLALSGAGFGIFLIPLCAVAVWGVRYWFVGVGYKQGHNVATGFAGRLKNLIEAASIIGLMVIGAMIPSFLTAVNLRHLTYQVDFSSIDIGTAEGAATSVIKNVQTDWLDLIMPSILPLTVVFLAYWLLGKKKISPAILILILFVIGFVVGNIHNIIAFFQK